MQANRPMKANTLSTYNTQSVTIPNSGNLVKLTVNCRVGYNNKASATSAVKAIRDVRTSNFDFAGLAG